MYAAEQYEQLGQTVPASGHFVASGADGRALEHAAAAVVEQWNVGIAIGTELPLRDVSDDWIKADPWRMYVKAAVLQCGLEFGPAASWLAQLDERVAADRAHAGLRARAELLALVNAALAMDSALALDREASLRQLLEPGWRLPELTAKELAAHPFLERLDRTIVAVSRHLLAHANRWQGEIAAAREVLEETSDNGPEAGSVTGRTALATTAVEEGRLRDACTNASAALEAMKLRGVERSAMSIGSHRVLGVVHLERDELEQSDEQLTASLKLAEMSGETLWVFAVELEIARLRVAQGRYDEAFDLVGRLRWADAWEPLPIGLRDHLGLVEIRCRLDVGDVRGATSVARAMGRRCPSTALARIDLRSGRPDRCRDRLAAHEPSRFLRERIEQLLLLAGTEVQLGRGRAAHTAVERAVEVGRLEWFVRVFLEEGDGVAAVLADLAERSRDAYLDHIVEALRPTGSASTGSSTGVILEPLTLKEREVLSRLTSHLSLHEIAA